MSHASWCESEAGGGGKAGVSVQVLRAVWELGQRLFMTIFKRE